jgi:hypothetical protein
VRLPHTWPVTTPRPVPPGALVADPLNPDLARRPLNDLEHHIVGIALARFTGTEPAQEAIPKTVGEAYTALATITKGAFGTS